MPVRGDLPVIYGDTPKSNVWENQTRKMSPPPRNRRMATRPPLAQLEQANRILLVAQSGAQEMRRM